MVFINTQHHNRELYFLPLKRFSKPNDDLLQMNKNFWIIFVRPFIDLCTERSIPESLSVPSQYMSPVGGGSKEDQFFFACQLLIYKI